MIIINYIHFPYIYLSLANNFNFFGNREISLVDNIGKNGIAPFSG